MIPRFVMAALSFGLRPKAIRRMEKAPCLFTIHKRGQPGSLALRSSLRTSSQKTCSESATLLRSLSFYHQQYRRSFSLQCPGLSIIRLFPPLSSRSGHQRLLEVLFHLIVRHSDSLLLAEDTAKVVPAKSTRFVFVIK